jgi:hypothetical protein
MVVGGPSHTQSSGNPTDQQLLATVTALEMSGMRLGDL